VPKLYSFSIGTQGSSRRSAASWSPRRVSSFSRASSSPRAASHSSRVATLRFVIAIAFPSSSPIFVTGRGRLRPQLLAQRAAIRCRPPLRAAGSRQNRHLPITVP